MDIQYCVDCGVANVKNGQPVHGFGSVITHGLQSRIYCSECKTRRGLAYLFDSRSWREIEAAQKASAA